MISFKILLVVSILAIRVFALSWNWLYRDTQWRGSRSLDGTGQTHRHIAACSNMGICCLTLVGMGRKVATIPNAYYLCSLIAPLDRSIKQSLL